MVFITEAWINEKLFDDSLASFEIPGYNLFTYQRQNKVGGGIAIYIKDCFMSLCLSDIKRSDDIESIWLDVHCNSNNRHPLRIGVFYRPPGQNRSIDEELLDEIERGTSFKTIVIGDFNLPKLNLNTARSNELTPKMFKECFEENFLTQLVQTPTRKDEILDYVLVNEDDLVTNLEIGEPLGNSDHNIIRFSINNFFEKHAKNLESIPNFRKGDYDNMRLYMRQFNWESDLEDENAFGMWELFKYRIFAAQRLFIPMRKIRSQIKCKPVWLTQAIKKEVKEKKMAFICYKAEQSQKNRAVYIAQRKRVNMLIRRAKRASEINLSRACAGDMKKFFSFYKFRRKRNKVGPFTIQNNVIDDNVSKCNILNGHYASVFTKESVSIFPIMKRRADVDILSDFDISEDEIRQYLSNLKENKACGPDEIYAKLLRELSHELALPLRIIFNRSLKFTEIPRDWKDANVIPVFKGGSKTDPSSDRAVSLTSLICKIFVFLNDIIRMFVWVVLGQGSR